MSRAVGNSDLSAIVCGELSTRHIPSDIVHLHERVAQTCVTLHNAGGPAGGFQLRPQGHRAPASLEDREHGEAVPVGGKETSRSTKRQLWT
ncbi:hypothetical protein COCON_G00230600 [Conger conger]|uniref:Uncharacterized protein n=1 Tax=Conger conger TaxID=82655 RepID=A0A9Q1HN09_CONCO|nr:hypothetical protein COCON_G00230600 [Conger conger]